MNAALLSLHYLPSIKWFGYYLKYDTIYIERCENFVKSTPRNHCFIAGAGGRQKLSIPLQGGRDHHQLYSSTLVSNSEQWQKKHWQSIRSSYGSTPFFEHYADKLQPFFEIPAQSLFDWNLHLLQVLLKMLKCDKPFTLTDSYEKIVANGADLRHVENMAEIVELPPYYQVFDNKNGFIANLSVIDIIFHSGPDAKNYIGQLT